VCFEGLLEERACAAVLLLARIGPLPHVFWGHWFTRTGAVGARARSGDTFVCALNGVKFT
jgi:hypothetical protein